MHKRGKRKSNQKPARVRHVGFTMELDLIFGPSTHSENEELFHQVANSQWVEYICVCVHAESQTQRQVVSLLLTTFPAVLPPSLQNKRCGGGGGSSNANFSLFQLISVYALHLHFTTAPVQYPDQLSSHVHTHTHTL